MLRKLDAEGRPDEPAAIMPEDASLQAALIDMQDVEFCRSERWQEQQWRADWTGVPADLKDFQERFINRARNMYSVPLYCHTARRSLAEQAKLLEQGRSKVYNGPHTHGLAVDIVHSTKHWQLSKNQWALIGHIGKEVAATIRIHLDWGGDWRYYDPAHWEITKWRLRVKK